MTNTNLTILLIILVLSYSFFSASETAFSSLDRVKIKALSNSGNKKAKETLKLIDNFSKLLTTILIGNTIVNVVAASLATVLFTSIFKNKGVAISSVIMTLVIMVIGEILPKNIAKKYPEKFALEVTPILKIIVLIISPLTYIFNYLDKILFNKDNNKDDSYSTEEFLTMVEEATEDGNFEDEEAEIITNALEFNDQDVGKIYTPKKDIVAFDIDNSTIDQIEQLYRETGYSRIPAYKGNLNNIIGVLHEKDLYYNLLHNKELNIEKLLQDVIYTSPQVKISSLLKQFQETKTHMAIVCDEYGDIEGIITMEDILEELVGEIYDEHDTVISHYKKINDNTYIIKGELNIEEFFELFGIDNNEEFEFNTTSAWIIDKFDKIPKVNEKIEYQNLSIEVTKANAKLINEIKVIINNNQQTN